MTKIDSAVESVQFSDLALRAELLNALNTLGFTTPTPIQSQAITPLLEGRDLIGQAQTGTGKTAAFILPILHELDVKAKKIQALVIAPTRELAAQIAQSAETLGSNLPGLKVLTIYGGQSYPVQKRAIKAGAQLVVATPGRLIDLIDQGAINMGEIRNIVLDEADEMLSMGFIDDMEKILGLAPADAQRALFSATLSKQVLKIAHAHLKNPLQIQVGGNVKAQVERIEQRFLCVKGGQRVTALSQSIELCDIDAAIVFVRTKQQTTEIADALSRQNIKAEAINGDMPQNLREQTVERLRSKQIDVLVATDVVARGLDVQRVSHVFNIDLPTNSDTYVHRIGRTGRAGRSGTAISIISPAQMRAVSNIARNTGQEMTEMARPTVEAIRAHRIAKLKTEITIKDQYPDQLRQLATELLENADPADLVCALMSAWQGERLTKIQEINESHKNKKSDDGKNARRDRGTNTGGSRDRNGNDSIKYLPYRIAIGRSQGLTAGAVVGALVNEGGLDPADVGGIQLREEHSVVQLNSKIAIAKVGNLSKIKIRRQAMNLMPMDPSVTGDYRGVKKTKKPVRFKASA